MAESKSVEQILDDYIQRRYSGDYYARMAGVKRDLFHAIVNDERWKETMRYMSSQEWEKIEATLKLILGIQDEKG